MDARTRKPMAVVRQVSFVRREIRERVSPVGLELLLRSASRISEGRIAPDGRYYGSTMLTIDLALARDQVREACDVATATRLARLLEQDAQAKTQLRELAIAEARGVARRTIGKLEVDMRVRVEGSTIFVDLDVDGVCPQRAHGGPRAG
jgi:hypothetical protein